MDNAILMFSIFVGAGLLGYIIPGLPMGGDRMLDHICHSNEIGGEGS